MFLKQLVSKWIVVEPLVFLFIMTNMNGVPVQNIYYNKFSKILKNSTHDLGSEEVDKRTNEFIINTTIIYSGLSACVMAIIGPLSDRYRRKFGILWTVALTGMCNIAFGLLYYLDTNNIANKPLSLATFPNYGKN